MTIEHDASVKVLPATVAVPKRRTSLSLAVLAAGYALLAMDNFVMPGGFNLLLACFASRNGARAPRSFEQSRASMPPDDRQPGGQALSIQR